AGRGERAAVRTERQLPHQAFVTGQRATDRLGSVRFADVPQLHGAVLHGDGQGVSVGTEHRGVHLVGCTLQRATELRELAVAHPPQPRVVIVAPADQVLAVR